MEVYINMEMPKSCAVCPFENYGDCYGGKVKAIMDIDDYVYYGKRHPRCPLIEIPPHGDLIGRNPLIDIAMHLRNRAKNEYTRRAIDSVIRYIAEAPTIIPASDKDINVLGKEEPTHSNASNTLNALREEGE